MRGDLIGCMCAVTGKTVIEGDVEVSEAVDYARFYTTAMKKFAALDDIEIKVPYWSFHRGTSRVPFP